MDSKTRLRISQSVKKSLSSATKTTWWITKITVIVSFVILVLRYFGAIDWLSMLLSPFFSFIGLPGEAALAYVSGYFVSVYSAIAAMVALNFDYRSITILSVMVLCSHNMITETLVQRKTGSSAWKIVVIRTLSAIILGFVLNLLLPKNNITQYLNSIDAAKQSFAVMFIEWLKSTLLLILKMIVIIFSLSIIQSVLNEFGIIRRLSKGFKPLMVFFGLPVNTAFLWIVANIFGLAYGSAIMIEETNNGNVSQQEADLLNHHIGISHSNLEDLLLLAAIGASIWWLLLLRWVMSLILVWERKLEIYLFKIYS